MLSRLVELGRARGVAPDAWLWRWRSPLGALRRRPLAQDALGLRGGGETLADSVPPLAPPTPAPRPMRCRRSSPRRSRPTIRQAEGQARKDRRQAARQKLPALKPYPGAQRLGLRGGPADNDPRRRRRPSPRCRRRAKRKPPPDDKPFDPIGVKIGDLKLTPYVEEDGGWASNPGSVAGPHQGSAFETTEAGLGLQSDWSRSDLQGC